MATTPNSSSSASSPGRQTREESVLESFFILISQFSFDKAKDLMDKEKEMHKISGSTSWGTVLQCLSQFTIAEKVYMSLSSLGQKTSTIRFTPIVRPKENLRTLYHFLTQEFHRLEEASHQDSTNIVNSIQSSDIEILLSHISGQLCQYIAARQNMADLYESVSRHGYFEDLVAKLSDIIFSNNKTFHHPLLSPIKSSFTLECEIMHHLLQAQLLLCDWQFLASLLELQQAHRGIITWSSMTSVQQPEKSKKSSKGSGHSIPALFQWLQKFHGLLVSKFSLYFYEMLSKQTPGDIKNLTAKTTEDFVGRLIAFQKKYDATNIYLILDTNGQTDIYKGPGYHHPLKYVERPKGKDTYPFILCLPSEKPAENIQACILMMVNDRDMTEAASNGQDRVKTFYDKMSSYLRGYARGESLEKFIDREIRPPKDFKDRVNHTVDQLVRYLHKMPGYNIQEVVKSGSLGKGTSVLSDADADMVVFFNGYTDIESLIADKLQIIRDVRQYMCNPNPGWFSWLFSSKPEWVDSIRVLRCNNYFIKFVVYVQYKGRSEPVEVDVLPAMDVVARHGKTQSLITRNS
ncbi:KICSTOR subunit 2 isoform X2 [Patella vulgata]|uniref:KICSTOR subunit 2 isoform X2 n=1 Tax=Patella vulgata TaxID=6465 RepID=UPI0021805B67|nr:KICSTOR subunit 2 isoform X2 [Patella vulgata]